MGIAIVASSVRPTPEVCGVGEESEEELEVEVGGTEGERLRLEVEEDVIKLTKDPLLPRTEGVEKHYLVGHNPYRNWCPVCVKSQGRDTPHRGQRGKERTLPEYSSDSSGPYS